MMEQQIIPSGKFMDKKIDTLLEIKVDVENWNIYYLDEKNGEKWIQEYPFSEAQGGGPAQLRLITRFPWEI